MLPRSYVSRPRLLDKLLQTTQCKLTIVCADAGYGKTSLVTEFARMVKLRSEWHALGGSDRDVGRLFRDLEGSLRRLGMGAEPERPVRTRLRRAKAPDIAILTEALLGQARNVGPEPVLLILDDYQNVDQEADVNLLLGSLIENAPASVRFIVLSRSVPRFPLARLKARQEMCMIEEDDLAFRADETARFLGGGERPALDEGSIALVQERTEGWPAGVAMVSQSLRYGRQDKVMSVLADPAASAWLVYDYLAEEVFDRQQPSVREFLVKTSVLEAMNGAVCDHLLGVTSSQRTLLALEEGGLFTARVDPSRQAFRYHQLFREFLRQKLHQLESQEAVRGLHLRAAQYYEPHSAWEECVHHYLKAGEAEKAARVVEAVGEKYILAGLFQTVGHWLKSLPEELTTTRPWLLVLRAKLSHMSVRNEEALRLLERALRAFQKGGDEEGEANACGEIAYVKYRSQQIQQAIRYFELALSKARGNDSLRASILATQPGACRYGGLLDASIEACRAAFAAAEGIDDEGRRMQVQSRATRDMAVTLMEQGDLDTALRAAEEALDLSHSLGEYDQSLALMHLGTVLWACGRLNECVDALNRGLSMSGRHIRQLQERIGSRLGNALRDAGRMAEAERAYALGAWESEIESGFLMVLTHQAAAGRARAEALYQQWHTSENVVARSSVQVVLGTALREDGDLAGALEYLREGVRDLESCGYRLRLASALLHQARVEHDLSLPEAGRTLSRAFQLAADGSFYHFFWWDPELVGELCRRAVVDGILPEYAVQLAARRFGDARAETLRQLISSQQASTPQSGRAAAPSPSGMPGEGLVELLTSCGDPHVEGSILQAAAEGMISAEGLRALRLQYGLTWREIEVLIEYYLRPAVQPGATDAPLRVSCAKRLGISKNTVRCHISSIRGKLALPGSLSGRGIVAWAELHGLLPATALRPPLTSSLFDTPRDIPRRAPTTDSTGPSGVVPGHSTRI